MLQRYDKPTSLLCDPSSVGSVGNSPALGFSANVENDRACRGIKVIIIDKVPLKPSFSTLVVIMVENLSKPILLLGCKTLWLLAHHLLSLNFPPRNQDGSGKDK